LLLIAGYVCLAFGWWGMLPDDFENLAQSVVATNFFGNNVLAAITTKNYWEVVNEFKPLMHTWYVGVLMQYYVVITLLLLAIGSWIKEQNRQRFFAYTIGLLGVVSFALYFMGSPTEVFYYLPFRFFEFSAGSVVYFCAKESKLNGNKVWNVAFIGLYVLLVSLYFINVDGVDKSVRLLATVVISSLLVYMMPVATVSQNKLFSNSRLAVVGAASYSVFVWHQVIFACTRYSFTSELTKPVTLVIIFSIIVILSFLSYRYVEKMKETRMAWGVTMFLLALTTACSLYIYKIAGVTRDVPELDVVKGESHRGMWAEYCDRGYQYDKDYVNNGKPKWYVIGNSFGRDFVNIIAESSIKEQVDMTYSSIETYASHPERFEKADVVILSTLGLKEELVNDLKGRCPVTTRFVIVGEKNFGESNGQIYSHRFSPNYHQLTVRMEEGYEEKNEKMKNLYKDNDFIDLIEMVRQSDGTVRVFSDDGRYISQDCHHLTQAGAQFYASKLHLEQYLPKSEY
jgi:peptidoglycan/LPS O-acetylase OafA/YrhL